MIVFSSLIEFSNGFFFLNSLNSVKFDLTLSTFLESTDGSSDLLVIVEIVSECCSKIAQF